MSSVRSSSELLESTLAEWTDLYGRKMSLEAAGVWMRLFARVSPGVLAEALEVVTKNSDRMPTPGHLTMAIGKVLEKGQRSFSYADPNCSQCNGDGWFLRCISKVDPTYSHEPKEAVACPCTQSRELRMLSRHYDGAVDADGNPCIVEPSTGEYLYLPQDCSEGREFLVRLAEFAGKKDLAAKYRQASEEYRATDEDIPF